MLAARSIPKPAFPVHDPHPDDPGRSGAYGTCCSELTNAPHGANFIAMATATERGPAAWSHVSATAHGYDPATGADVKPYVQFQNIDAPPEILYEEPERAFVARFIGGLQQRTVPRQMWSGIREEISPAILAVATFLFVLALLFMTAVEWLRARGYGRVSAEDP